MAGTYDPSSYNPNMPSPTANGTTGSQTSQSIQNAAIQSKPAAGNPYADAIQHTANWMSYIAPGSSLNPANTAKSAQPVLSNGTPSVGTIGTGDTIGQPGQTPVWLPQTTGATTTRGVRPITAPTPTTSTTNLTATDTNTTPTGSPAQPPDAPATPTGPRSMAPPENSGPGPSTATTQPLAGREWTDADYQNKANEYAQTPGFGWLSQHPEIVKAYQAEALNNPETAGMNIAEWIQKNWTGISQKLGVSPQDAGPMRDAMNGAAYTRAAQRLQNEYKSNGGTGDASWITPEVFGRYDQYRNSAWNNSGKFMDFWTWARTTNNGTGGTNTGGTGAGTGAGAGSGTGTTGGGHTPFPGWNTGGNSGNGGGGGGSSTYNSGPQGGYSPSGQTYLDNLMNALRSQYNDYNDQQMREFRHQAGLGGLQNSGAYGTNLGNLQRQLLGDENSNLANVMAQQTDAERQRAAQLALGQISAAASRYGADQGLAGAQAAAAASQYGSLLDYNRGIYGIDATREGNAMQNNLNYQDLMLKYLQMIYGSSPDQILGGYNPPTGTSVPHY